MRLLAFSRSRSRLACLACLALGACAASACGGGAPGTIGAQLGQRTDGRLFVRGVPAGQGADKAGLEVEDEILAIEGHAVAGMSQEDVKRAVRGGVGSTMVLTVDRGGLRRDVKVQRSPMLGDSNGGERK